MRTTLLAPSSRTAEPSHRPIDASWRILCITLGIALIGLTACSNDEETSQPGIPVACEDEFPVTAADPNLLWTPSATTLVSEELSLGVFAIYASDAAEKGPNGIPLATSSGFVIGDDGVLVVDSMINRRLACQVIGLVREQTDKPIQYVVNTSYHGDHLYGNYIFPESTQIVHHEQTKSYVEEHFAADLEFMMQNFGQDQGLQDVVPRTGDILVDNNGMTLDLGGRQVELHYFGFAQTPGDVFVWLPDAEVLWTGNPLIAEAPALPWLLDGHLQDSIVTLRAMRDFLPVDARIVPGHGRPVLADGVAHTIDYLEALEAEITTAIEQGLTLEQTVAAVTMGEFNAYAIFDWVHFQVNVPKAYEELSGN